MTKLSIEESFLADIAATSPTAQQIVDELRARRKRRGRPPKNEFQYRRLQSRWKLFRRLNASLTEEQARKRFLRRHGSEIESVLGLKHNTIGSLRNAVARGEKERERILSCRAEWQIVPAGIAHAVHGRQYRIATSRHEATLIRAAERAALLGELSTK